MPLRSAGDLYAAAELFEFRGQCPGSDRVRSGADILGPWPASDRVFVGARDDVGGAPTSAAATVHRSKIIDRDVEPCP